MNAPVIFPICRLSHRLTLERPVRAPDGGGGASVTWETVADMWAAVEALGGGERVDVGRLAGDVNARITIRHRDDVTPAMRFRIGTQVYEIVAALDGDGGRRFLRCDCQRRNL